MTVNLRPFYETVILGRTTKGVFADLVISLVFMLDVAALLFISVSICITATVCYYFKAKKTAFPIASQTVLITGAASGLGRDRKSTRLNSSH